MKVKVVCIGKTGKDFLEKGEQEYLNRLKHYLSVERIEIPDVKNQKKRSNDEIKKLEGEQIKKCLSEQEQIYLLDERGKSYSSEAFASFLENKLLTSTPKITFVIGGPYGFTEELKSMAKGKISLSEMTFSHQMVRMIFFEQLYRAMTILKGEKYHHA
ncbi:MAG: 23S rRNA (pseudouridine(1915)-N(3))-methyltransferase RlmH [Bacteroidetes bacterium]|nr:MAG: 23S rRNA (pseudouridine(1915)-N(3))-methyltransferase RlmH [Bacteroidota bacterium]